MTTEHHRKLAEHAIDIIESTPTDRWKHHGFGLLQVSVTPAHRINLEQRCSDALIDEIRARSVEMLLAVLAGGRA